MKFAADRFLCEGVGDDVFLVDQESGDSWRIGGSGARMWELLIGGAPPAAVAEQVASMTGAERARVRADVDEFVTQLRTIGALLDADPA